MKLGVLEEFLSRCAKVGLEVPPFTIEVEDFEENVPEEMHSKSKVEFNTRDGQRVHITREKNLIK